MTLKEFKQLVCELPNEYDDFNVLIATADATVTDLTNVYVDAELSVVFVEQELD